jgi:hypothetical protein
MRFVKETRSCFCVILLYLPLLKTVLLCLYFLRIHKGYADVFELSFETFSHIYCINTNVLLTVNRNISI